MRVLVTGGAGYIGSVVVQKLVDKGWGVRVMDKFIFGKAPLKHLMPKIEVLDVDIRNARIEDLKNIDAIIHLAGFSTEPTSQYDPRLTDLVNHIATEHLAKLARGAGVKRFVYASTCSIYFTLNTPLEPTLYKESDTVNPISCYSLTKRCSEQVLWGMSGRDFQPTIFRKGTLYGLSPRMRYDLVFNSFAKDAFVKRSIWVDAAGEIWRPMIDVQDAADAYIKCLELPISKVGGKMFNVTDQNWKIGDLAQKFKEILKKEKNIDLGLDIKPYGVTRNYKADNTLFKETFGFRPSRTIEDALLEIWEYLESHPKHDPSKPVYYGDLWYKAFFETSEGRKFKKHT